jgi:hypothetical protein
MEATSKQIADLLIHFITTAMFTSISRLDCNNLLTVFSAPAWSLHSIPLFFYSQDEISKIWYLFCFSFCLKSSRAPRIKSKLFYVDNTFCFPIPISPTSLLTVPHLEFYDSDTELLLASPACFVVPSA